MMNSMMNGIYVSVTSGIEDKPRFFGPFEKPHEAEMCINQLACKPGVFSATMIDKRFGYSVRGIVRCPNGKCGGELVEEYLGGLKCEQCGKLFSINPIEPKQQFDESDHANPETTE